MYVSCSLSPFLQAAQLCGLLRLVFFRAASHLRSDHSDFEQDSLVLDLLLQFGQALLREVTRGVGDLDQHTLELVEDRCDRRVTGALRALPIEPVGFEQITRALLLFRDVEATFAGFGIRQLDQHHLRALQVRAYLGTDETLRPVLILLRDLLIAAIRRR